MNLRRVSIFVQVVESAGFTAAARALGLPKSAVSSAVSLLEEELGVQLLRRTSRTLTLTDAGAALHARAAPALRGLDEAAAAARDAQGALRGRVRLSAPVEVGTRMLEPLVARFLKKHPEVQAEVVLSSSGLDLIDEGIDLAVRSGRVTDEGLCAQRLGTLDAGLFAAPAYLKGRGRPKTLRDVAAHACVVQRVTLGKSTWRLVGPGGEESVEVTARLTADHCSFILRALVSGVGIGLLPEFLCAEELRAGQLARVLPRYAVRGTPLQLLWPSRNYEPRAVAALRAFLIEAFIAQ